MINIPKGTKDVLPSDSYKWHYVEGVARDVAALFGFKEIRTPTFEHTELFLRGVGETTDIVNKEMYTFEDKGGRSMTLRPEGTAGVARCFIENGLQQGVLPMKAYYLASVFRYERPQNGRLREHHQFGVECYGSDSPSADAEVISLAYEFLQRVGVKGLELCLNSIGCPDCRAKFNEALKAYIGDNLDAMCATCRERFQKNPLRILDCKEEGCRRIVAGAPKITDFLCDDCKTHFEGVQELLSAAGIPFRIAPMIVRGLDYYTRTVFEFTSNQIGAQGTVCGGGRYNNLVEQIGGKHMPAVGFGLGIERLLLVLENADIFAADPECVYLYIAPICAEARPLAQQLTNAARALGISAETDIMDRSVKAQLKYADRAGAKIVAVIGEDELARGAFKVKDMHTGEERETQIDEFLADPSRALGL